MGIFSKKKKDSEDNSGIKKAEYKVILKEKLGDTTRTIKSFNAYRKIDTDNHVVMLINDDKKIQFMEIFPEEIHEFKDFDKQKVLKKLIQLKQLYNKEIENDTELNDKDLEYEIRKLEAIRRSFEFKKGSYISFGEDGQPEFTFLREGSSFHPFRWDAETKTIYTPSDNKKKSAILSLRNKEQKYSNKNLVETSTVILLILGIVLVIGNLIIGYHIWGFYDESKIAEIQRTSLSTLDVCSEYLVKNVESVNQITEKLSEQLTQEPTPNIDLPPTLK